MTSKPVPGVSLSIKMGISNPNLFIKSAFASIPNWSPTFLSSKIRNGYLGIVYEDDSCAIHSLDQNQQKSLYISRTKYVALFVQDATTTDGTPNQIAISIQSVPNSIQFRAYQFSGNDWTVLQNELLTVESPPELKIINEKISDKAVEKSSEKVSNDGCGDVFHHFSDMLAITSSDGSKAWIWKIQFIDPKRMKLKLCYSISSPSKISSIMITPNAVIIGGSTNFLYVYKLQTETEGKETLEYYSIQLVSDSLDSKIIKLQWIPYFNLVVAMDSNHTIFICDPISSRMRVFKPPFKQVIDFSILYKPSALTTVVIIALLVDNFSIYLFNVRDVIRDLETDQPNAMDFQKSLESSQSSAIFSETSLFRVVAVSPDCLFAVATEGITLHLFKE